VRDGTRRIVLLIDDDEDLLDVVGLALEGEGYRILTAPNGAAALDLINQAPPALILLDVLLSVTDGRQFIRAYRETPGPHAPLILVSAIQNLAEVAQEVGAEGYLTKPFELNELLRVVGKYSRAVA
jgi:CheY-like chemotaxis protein